MSRIVKILLALVLMAGVLVYTVYNYAAGRTEQFAFFVYIAVIAVPFINMVNILIQELRNR